MDGSMQLDFAGRLAGHAGEKQAENKSSGVRLSPTRVGVALFDADGLSDSGWACVAGEPPYRIKSGFTLSTDAIWWSNLTSEQLLGRCPKTVRDMDYTKVPMSQAMGELGLNSLEADEAVEQLALHFTILTRLIEKMGNTPLQHLARTRYLHTDLTPLGGAVPILQPAATTALLGKGGKWMWTKIENAKNVETICFRAPRLSYALSLLQTGVPAQAVTWRQKPSQDPLETIRSTLAPVYAEYSLQNAMAKPAQLFGLANNGDNAPGCGRFLAAHPELLALEAFADLKVHGVWKGTDYKPASETIPPQVMSFLTSKPALFSWSAGVIAHALMLGICSPSVSHTGQKTLSFRGAWLRGADKVTMFSNAMGFHKAGFRPTSYGFGWIKVLRPETATASAGLLSVAVRRGLLPDPGAFDPAILADVANGTYGPPNPESGWGVGAFPARLALHNEYHHAAEFDDLPLKSDESRKKAEGVLRELFRSR